MRHEFYLPNFFLPGKLANVLMVIFLDLSENILVVKSSENMLVGKSYFYMFR